jgi:hypothetical protein
MAYNFGRTHKTLTCSPAMAAGVANELWDIVDLVRMVEEWEARQVKFKLRHYSCDRSPRHRGVRRCC